VFKLQSRIYRASQRGNVQLRRRLQRLLLHATSAKYWVSRRVTQDNQGKKTAGVDGVVSLTPEQRLVGALAVLTPGEAIVARGWCHDAKHGWQFMAADYRTTRSAALHIASEYVGPPKTSHNMLCLAAEWLRFLSRQSWPAFRASRARSISTTVSYLSHYDSAGVSSSRDSLSPTSGNCSCSVPN
jgi:N-terminal domain of reverse transcriptase